jgi:7 transmembrane receptor (rhodopsin family)
MVLGVMGNLATCLVILNNEYMRTPTNVYLLNLAIADIATLVISEYLSMLRSRTAYVNFCVCVKIVG